MDLTRLRHLRLSGAYAARVTTHAKVEGRKDGLTEQDLDHAFRHGEVIEDYGWRALLLDFTVQDELPVHIVLEDVRARREVVVVSAYVPDPELWEPDWKTRRRGEDA